MHFKPISWWMIFKIKWYSVGIYSWNIKYFDNSVDTQETGKVSKILSEMKWAIMFFSFYLETSIRAWEIRKIHQRNSANSSDVRILHRSFRKRLSKDVKWKKIPGQGIPPETTHWLKEPVKNPIQKFASICYKKLPQYSQECQPKTWRSLLFQEYSCSMHLWYLCQ